VQTSLSFTQDNKQVICIIFKIKILYVAQQTVNLALKSDAMVYWLVTLFLKILIGQFYAIALFYGICN
jgi:hypothetical protein